MPSNVLKNTLKKSRNNNMLKMSVQNNGLKNSVNEEIGLKSADH
jgi:hypothetical protein